MSQQDMQHPLVEQGPNEEPVQFGNVIPLKPKGKLPGMKNYASDPEIRQFILTEFVPLIDQTRIYRISLEDEWSEIGSMNRMKHTSKRKYMGRSDMYFPIYKRERQKFVSQLSRGLFPSDDYFDCVNGDESNPDPEAGKRVKHYMQWEMERNAKFRTLIKPFLAQLADYGTSPLKFWYRKDLSYQGGSKKPTIPGLPMMYGMNKVIREGLAVSARKLQYWYVWPPTAESLDDASLIFEDIDVPQSYVERMGKTGRWENIDEVSSAAIVPRHQLTRNEMLQQQGVAPTLNTGISTSGSIVTVTEVWTFMILPSAEYVEGEPDDCAIPVRIVLINGIPVEVRRNPFFHQKPPYAVARMGHEAGFFYGDGQGRLMQPFQVMINDLFNQTNDNGIMSLNPVALINPGMMVGPPRPLAPGVPWYVSDVDKAVKWDRPPIDTAQYGIQHSQMLVGMAQDVGGAPPDRSAQSRGAKTATGMQVLQRNAMLPLQDVTEDIENDVMVPVLWGGWKNAVQFREQAVLATVAGQSMQISPEDLAIEADFRYLASSQAQNNQVRTQQAQQLIQAVSPIVPLLMQQGYVVDFVALIRRIYVDGMGFRGFNEFIQKAQAVPQMGPPRPDQLGGVQAEQQDRMRSALEQLDGMGSTEAQPGEAEDFMEVRQNADDLAGQMGGAGGGGMG
jgi:hypothetical protein